MTQPPLHILVMYHLVRGSLDVWQTLVNTILNVFNELNTVLLALCMRKLTGYSTKNKGGTSAPQFFQSWILPVLLHLTLP